MGHQLPSVEDPGAGFHFPACGRFRPLAKGARRPSSGLHSADPMHTIREFPLAQEETRDHETLFTLIFTEDGQMFARSVRQSCRTFERLEERNIPPAEFGGVQVKGASLAKIVAVKLAELLPPSPPKYPEYRTTM